MKNKAVFLDRDGVINYWTPEINVIKSPDEVKILPTVYESIRQLNAAGFIVIVVSNQPGVSWGQITYEGVEKVNKYIDDQLKKKCAYVHDWYFCPHYPIAGHQGEVIEYKVKCNCRKPEPGMLMQAQKKWHLTMPLSYMIGDRQKDIEAGNKAGCKRSFLMETNSSLITPVNLILEEIDNEN